MVRTTPAIARRPFAVRILILSVAMALGGLACGQLTGVHKVEGPGRAARAGARDATARVAPRTTRQYTTVVTVSAVRAPQVVRVTRTITWEDWARLLLERIEAADCKRNLAAVVAWEAAENTRANWNPLATTYDVPGTTVINEAGVRNYRSLDEGLDATEATLARNWSTQGYSEIVRSLRACARPMVTARAINASGWCRGCVAGRYVLDIVPSVARYYGIRP